MYSGRNNPDTYSKTILPSCRNRPSHMGYVIHLYIFPTCIHHHELTAMSKISQNRFMKTTEITTAPITRNSSDCWSIWHIELSCKIFKNGPIFMFFIRILGKLYLYYVFISLMLIHNIFLYPWFYLSDLALFCMLYITDANSKLDIIMFYLALFCISCIYLIKKPQHK